MREYVVNGSERVQADMIRVDAGALVFVRLTDDGQEEFRAYGPNDWSTVVEGGAVSKKPQESSGLVPVAEVPDVPMPGKVAKPTEPAVPTAKLWEWVEKVRSATPAASFMYDSDLIAMIEEAEGGRKWPEPGERRLQLL